WDLHKDLEAEQVRLALGEGVVLLDLLPWRPLPVDADDQRHAGTRLYVAPGFLWVALGGIRTVPLFVLKELGDDENFVWQMVADHHLGELVHHPLDRRGHRASAILSWNHARPHLPLRVQRQVYVWLLQIGPEMLENILLGIPANLRIEEEELLGVARDLEV